MVSRDAEKELRRILDVATAAAREAGALMRSNCGLVQIEKFKMDAADLATKIDRACEDIVKVTALRHFPHHKILGEESVAPGQTASDLALAEVINSEWLWIIDPIDGTTNFVHGIPCSVVSIGVSHRGQVVVGVIYDPYRDEMFTAMRGHGTRLNYNEERAQVNDSKSMGESIFAMPPSNIKGPHADSARLASFDAAREVAATTRGMRDFGAAALHLAWTAVGRLSGYAQHGLCVWDIAAGALLVEEAGGKITDTKGRDYNLTMQDVCVTNGIIHADLLALLKRHKADGSHTDLEPLSRL